MSIRCNEWTVCSLTCFLLVSIKGFDFAKCEVLLISSLAFLKSQESSHLVREHFIIEVGNHWHCTYRVVSEQHYYFCCSIIWMCQKFEMKAKVLSTHCLEQNWTVACKHLATTSKWHILSIFKWTEVNTTTAAIYLKKKNIIYKCYCKFTVTFYLINLKKGGGLIINCGMCKSLDTHPVAWEFS